MERNSGLILFIVICTLNSLKDPLGISSGISTILSLFVLLPSIYYCVLVHKKWKLNTYLKGLDVFLVIVTIYGISSIIEGRNLELGNGNKIISYKFLLTHYMSLLPIYLFYYYGRLGKISTKIIRAVFLTYLLVGVVNYFSYSIRVEDMTEADNVVNNFSYSFVSLIPLLFLTKWGDFFKFALAITIFMIVLFGMKRGAILITVLLLVFYVYRQSKTMIRKNLGKVVLIVSAMLVILTRYFYYLYNTNTFFQYRVLQTLEGYSSGRDEMYINYFEYFWNRTTKTHFLFGQGSFATVEIFGQYAHNDWLEIAIDMGIVGVMCYFIYWFCFCKEWTSFNKGLEKDVFSGILIAFLARSLFSMSIYSITIDVALCIGYCLAYKAKTTTSISRIKRNMK